MLPGAALSSLAARFCWQGQHFRLWTVPERVSGPPPRCCQAQHFGASRLVSAGRGSTSGSGRCPSAFRGPPPLMLPGAALPSLAARFCWQGQHFRLWTVPERVSGPPPLDAARRSTFEPRGSFLLAQAALQALDGARARFGAPLDAARRSTSEPRGSFLLAGGSTSGSGRCPSAFRGPPASMLPRRSTFEPRGSFLLAGAALQALDGARARFGARCRGSERVSGPPPQCCQAQHFRASRLVSAGRGSTSGSGR